MVNLTNRLVQENLYKILNILSSATDDNPKMFIGEDNYLVIEINETTIKKYPYNTSDRLSDDYFEIIRIKNLLKK